MNTNPSAKRILIYGDSIVFGKVPKEEKRFPINETFPGVIQNTLGTEYEVIGEGLRGRMLAGENPLRPERNGLEQFGPILASHLPIDLVVIMLGTNDCNKPSEKSAEEYKKAFLEYLEKIKSWCNSFFMSVPKVLIVVPPPMITSGIIQDDGMNALFGEFAEEKSKHLPEIYQSFCQENNISFFDAGSVCSVDSTEGVHPNLENHILLGKALSEKILEIM